MLKLPVIGNVDCKSKIKVTRSQKAHTHNDMLHENNKWQKFLFGVSSLQTLYMMLSQYIEHQ